MLLFACCGNKWKEKQAGANKIRQIGLFYKSLQSVIVINSHYKE